MPDDPARSARDRILRSPTYRLAEEDIELLARPELRPVRLQLELLKPEMILEEQGVRSTIVVFGGTRIPEPSAARRLVEQRREEAAARPGDAAAARALAVAERILAKARYYDEAREFGRLVSTTCQIQGKCDYVIITGGGPGIMEAANRGAHDVGAKSIGLNITLPHEQAPNPYITPDLCFQFRYFNIRKMHFLLRAKALVAFPGGFGTIDELMETLTLIQTRKAPPVPVILMGREFWERAIRWEFLADEGVIDDTDLRLFRYAETAAEAWEAITRFHAGEGG